jgi:hypothetical protein
MNDSDIRILHNEAMDYAQKGDIEKLNKNFELAMSHYREAYRLERQVVQEILAAEYGEPARTILLKSAGALALTIGEEREAEKMICFALSGNPPDALANELRDMLEDVNFKRHLDLRGLSLQSSEVQLTMAGNSFAFGMGPAPEIMERIHNFTMLSTRTLERIVGNPFRKKGKAKKEISMATQPYVSGLRAGSVTFTCHFGHPTGEYEIPGDFNIMERVIEDVTKNISSINAGDMKQLRDNIPDADYRMNFLTLTKELAPDGDNVTLFGITTMNDRIPKMVALNQTRKVISEHIDENESYNDHLGKGETSDKEPSIIMVTGILRFANDYDDNIQLETDEVKKMKVYISNGLSDIVRNYFSTEVRVKLRNNKNKKELISIDPI